MLFNKLKEKRKMKKIDLECQCQMMKLDLDNREYLINEQYQKRSAQTDSFSQWGRITRCNRYLAELANERHWRC